MAEVSFAYNGIVFGGANWKRLALYSNQATSQDSGRASCALGLKGDDTTGVDVDTYLQSMLVRLRKTNKSFSVCRGTARAEILGTVGASVGSDGNILITPSSGYSLVDSDIGQVAQFEKLVSPGVYELIGSLQIVGFEGVAPNFYVSEPIWIDGVSDHFDQVSFLNATVRVRLGTAQYLVSQEQKLAGVGIKPSASQIGDANDTKNNRRIRFDCAWQVLADSLHPDSEYRFDTSITEQFATNGTGLVAIDGVVTAGRLSGDPVGARQLLTVATTSFISNLLDGIESGATFEDVYQPILNYDEFENSMTFQFLKSRVNYPELSGIIDDPRLSNANISCVRDYSSEHGLANSNSPSSVTIDYSVDVKVVDPDAVSPSEIKAFWVDTLKRYLIDTVQTIYGGTLTILTARDLAYSPTQSTLSASMTFLVTGQTTKILFYNRVNYVTHNRGIEDLLSNDGRDYTALEMQRGQEILGKTSIIVTSLDSFQPNVSQGAISVGRGLGVSVRGSEPFSVRLVQSGTTQNNSDGQYETLVTPGDPDAILGYQATNGPGEWRHRSTTATQSPKYHRDIDGLSTPIKLVTSEFTSFWRWRSNVSAPSISGVEEGSFNIGNNESVARKPGNNGD